MPSLFRGEHLTRATRGPEDEVLTRAGALRADAAQGQAWTPGLEDDEETVYAVLPPFHADGLTGCWPGLAQAHDGEPDRVRGGVAVAVDGGQRDDVVDRIAPGTAEGDGDA